MKIKKRKTYSNSSCFHLVPLPFCLLFMAEDFSSSIFLLRSNGPSRSGRVVLGDDVTVEEVFESFTDKPKQFVNIKLHSEIIDHITAKATPFEQHKLSSFSSFPSFSRHYTSWSELSLSSSVLRWACLPLPPPIGPSPHLPRSSQWRWKKEENWKFIIIIKFYR